MPIMINPVNPMPETTSTAKEVVKAQNAPTSAGEVEPKVKKLHEEFRTRIDVCKTYRRKLVANWTVSIDYRRGKPFPSQTDEDQVAVNLDWVLTKSKVSNLFSQVPQVRLDHAPDTLAPWVSAFERKLNDTLVGGGVEAAMDECMPDCINAAGIGAILVSYEALTEDRELPTSSEPVEGEEAEMTSIPVALDHRYLVQRVSPADLLWPINFTGSNFDNAPWVGRSGRLPWAEAVKLFGLKEADRESILGEDRTTMDKLTHDVERDKAAADEMVGFDEVFYKENSFDVEAKSYSSIHHLVFVTGKDKPVVDEPWKGQQVGEDGTVVGAQKFPLRVLTLTYITDETIPPSDSAIGRPQVNEINKARTQMIKQRERSLPIRWYDVNRVDPAIQQSLMRGTWQAMIPVQGEGSRVIGEVARATMPNENFLFDKVAKADLEREWTVPPTAHQTDTSKENSDNSNLPYNTMVGRERAKVGSFIIGVAEVLGGLLCLYEDPSVFGEGFTTAVSKTLKYSILADSTVLLDVNQRLKRLDHFVNNYAKSGWVNIEPVMKEIATLTGLDPSIVIKAPSPKPPVEPNISLRLTGVEDMLNPLALAFLIKSGQAPGPELIEQAKGLIQQAVVPPQGLTMPGTPQALGGFPMVPEGQAGPPGAPPAPGTAPSGPPLPPPVAGPPAGSPTPPPQPPKVGEAHPNWTTMTALNKRTEGGQG